MGIANNRVAVFGDSVVAQSWGTPAITALVVSGGIATVTTGASHHLVAPGNWIGFGNPDDTFAWSSGVVQVLSVTNANPFSFTFSATFAGLTLPDGTYSSPGNWSYRSSYRTYESGYFRGLNSWSGSPFMVTAPYAVAGASTPHMLKAVQRSLAAGPKYDVAFIQCGSNDVGTGALTSQAAAQTAAAAALVNIDAAVTALVGAGKFVLVGTPAMRSANAGNFTATQQQYMNVAYTGLRNDMIKLFQSRINVLVIDYYEDISDGQATPDGGVIAAYAMDGSHPSTQGIRAISNNTKNQNLIKSVFKQGFDRQPKSILDDVAGYATGQQYPNLIQNGMMAGTTGTNGTGSSGTVATSWTAQRLAGTATVVCTAAQQRAATPGVPNSTKWGWGQNLAFTFLVQSEQIYFSSTNMNARITKGAWYRGGFTATAVGAIPATLLANIKMLIQVLSPVNVSALTFNDNSFILHNNGTPMADGEQIVIASDPIWIPADATFGNVIPYIVLTATSTAGGFVTGTATIQVSNAWFRQIPDPTI